MLSNSGYRYYRLSLLLVIAGWVIFKLIYPYPFTTHDSFYYIEAAVLHRNVNVWPIGYSKFLGLVRHLPYPVWSVVTVQFFLLEAACWLFFHTWRRFMRPTRVMEVILFVFLFLNPLLLYCSNYILSDSLFIALSILWFTQLMWIIYRPAGYMTLTHAVLLLLVFTVRYNALYYPLVGSLAFLLCRKGWRFAVAGIGLPLLLLGLFVFYTGREVERMTGKWQFSAYGAWKLANNALYMYTRVDPALRVPLPAQYASLDSMVRVFSAQNPPVDLLVDDETTGSYFMFKDSSSLVYYMRGHYGGGDFLNSRKWYETGPFYSSYGSCLIKTYPIPFLVYFVYPNFQRYLFPHGEILTASDFSLYEPFDIPLIFQYFKTDSQDESRIRAFPDKVLLYPFPLLFTLSHLFFLFGYIGFWIFGGFRSLPAPVKACLWMVLALWLIDLFFCVFSSAIVLRYQIFMFIVELSFGMYFVPLILHNLADQEKKSL